MSDRTKSVHFNDNVIIIEYNINDRIYEKPNIFYKLFKYMSRLLK
jgi:hypothetical protein